jgi:hypothetical protein
MMYATSGPRLIWDLRHTRRRTRIWSSDVPSMHGMWFMTGPCQRRSSPRAPGGEDHDIVASRR